MAYDVERRRFLKVAGAVGGALLLPRLLRAAPPTRAEAIARIADLASTSAIARYRWADRGIAPAGYIKGMAVSYAKVCHDLGTGDAYATEMAKAVADGAAKDALKHYEAAFAKAGMDNAKAGPATLRHLFVLMLGLGMRESSGRYCEGRDRSVKNVRAETAEAGLFQTSFNARSASPLLPKLFTQFVANPAPSFLDVFKEGVEATAGDLENFGDGDGLAFQKLSKECPLFAIQFAAIGLRNIRKHWGPINRREAELRFEADAMLKDVQALVDRDRLGPSL